ncbi:DUF4249 domain-containing protein [Mucilaginibacter sp.]|uniref:DUF4249 domain-containing protein n=1 Tax=Mucilaginibacter sp. TaxID=1882438 RepID=UPI00260B8341|nr:DUF4249 domain-containing protein [Mucilaginibacter sp.]MDB4920335.1 hypothetical protein [Mucilaginibacter sp.]
MANWKFLLFIILLSVGCKKPYNPKVISSPNTYLVVEGVININDITNIKLSRTVNLSNSVTNNPVDNAELFIESDNGSNYGLQGIGNGSYQLTGVTLDNTRKFRLSIKLDGQSYLSDYEQAKVTPPVDSVGFIATGNKLQIYVNTHDPKNDTHYYRYDYVETWRFHSKYASSFVSNGTSIVPRHEDQQVYYCFLNNTSSTILLSSSAKLKQDVIFQAPLTAIESTSEKIEVKYSILVHQYALTAQGYKFWENLKKNTEQLGSIFDAEPSQLSGNIHNVANKTEIVIGYISACSVQTKRIFITSEQLPETWKPIYPYDCLIDSLLKNSVQQVLVPGLEIPINGIYSGQSLNPIGYTASDPYCVDCTLRGSKQTPDFWE